MVLELDYLEFDYLEFDYLELDYLDYLLLLQVQHFVLLLVKPSTQI